MFGSYVLSLIAGGLYPVRRPAAKSPLSIQGLLDHAKSATIIVFELHDYAKLTERVHSHSVNATTENRNTFMWNGLTPHDRCFEPFHFVSRLQQKHKHIGSVVLQSHIRHMLEQANK
jgi:hypothetical protein